MPGNSKPPAGTTPESYDDLVRRIVPMPDTGYRPTRDEEREAEEHAEGPRIHAGDPAGQMPTTESIRDTLRGLAAADLGDLDVSIENGRVTLAGSVATQRDREEIVAAITDHPGVHAVLDLLRVRL